MSAQHVLPVQMHASVQVVPTACDAADSAWRSSAVQVCQTCTALLHQALSRTPVQYRYRYISVADVSVQHSYVCIIRCRQSYGCVAVLAVGSHWIGG